MAKHEPENLRGNHEQMSGRTASHTNVGVQDISQNRADTNEDKKDEVEYEECTTSNFEMIVVLSVWEVCKEGRNCTRPHYDCMPCGREMSKQVGQTMNKCNFTMTKRGCTVFCLASSSIERTEV